MANEIKQAIELLERMKGLDRAVLVEALREALEKAAGKSVTRSAQITVEIDPHTLQPQVYEIRTVVEQVQDPVSHISLEDARKLNPDVVVGNRLKVRTEPKDFGRIAAQTALQLIKQKLREAEQDRVYQEFKEREGDLVTGTVKGIKEGRLIVSIGQVEAVIPRNELSPRERYQVGDRITAVVQRVEKTSRGAFVRLSRACPELVVAKFEAEVPEIYDGTVEIKAIARDAGNRTKIAVKSRDPNVDAVGACVGIRGTRVKAVVDELFGEKIDVIPWSDDPVTLCRNALNPAEIKAIQLDPERKIIHVTVPQDQFSLAIGKRGQNSKLASQIVGWTIDIRGDQETLSIPETDSEPEKSGAPDGAVDHDASAPAAEADPDERTRDDKEGEVSDHS
ncbi:MAG TPA: transcription termination factor NusA [Candidatus Hydrogenedentes bacterium]|nr:transcription termination/antitermination protein NusA [Candidatus Hydrogenedentota bacterium]HOV60254.1 transcription termination factor NusA [Candidatus Hydrogenedentota bacterium]